jgi:hypothetical protein
MSQIKPDVLVCGLVTAMAAYKSLELYTAKCKIDQTVLRADKAFPGFKDKTPEEAASGPWATIVVGADLADELRRRLCWLKRLQIDYGVYSMMLVLGLFALLGFCLMLLEGVRDGWGVTIVIAACTMLVSLFGAAVNMAIEMIRLFLDSADASARGEKA